MYNKLLGGIEVGYMGPVTAPIALLISSHPTFNRLALQSGPCAFRGPNIHLKVKEGTLSVEWAKYTSRS